MIIERRLALACNVTFLLCLTVVHLLERSLDPLAISVSFYALTRHGWLMTTGFFALAGGTALVGRIAWRSEYRGTAAVLSTCSVAIIVLTVFPGDPWYPWERPPTIVGAIHALAACVPIVLLPFIALSSLSRRWRRQRNDQVARSAIACVTASIIVGAYILSQLAIGNAPAFAGLGERAVVITGVLWLCAMAQSGP